MGPVPHTVYLLQTVEILQHCSTAARLPSASVQGLIITLRCLQVLQCCTRMYVDIEDSNEAILAANVIMFQFPLVWSLYLLCCKHSFSWSDR